MNTKICGICKQELELNLTNFATHSKRGFQSNCRICHKKYRQQHYLANKDKYIKKAKKWTQNFVNKFNEFKQTLKCSRCEENHPRCLDFHHLDPSKKEKSISQMINYGNIEKIKKEIAKCIVLCSNCHRKLHYEEQQNNNIGQ